MHFTLVFCSENSSLKYIYMTNDVLYMNYMNSMLYYLCNLFQNLSLFYLAYIYIYIYVFFLNFISAP